MISFALAAWLSYAATAAPAPAPELPGLVVLSLRADPTDQGRAGVLDELLLAEIEKYGRYKVLGMSDVKAMVGFDKIKDVMGCDDVSCAVQLGGALGVRYIVAGSVTSLEGDIIITLKMLDVQAAVVLDRATADARNNPHNYPDLIARAVAQLDPIAAVMNGSAVLDSDPRGATLFVDGKEVGAAPQTLTLAPGKHEVRGTLDGYLESTQPFTVASSDKAKVTLKLAKVPVGKLQVTTRPGGARVSVAGAVRGKTPTDGNALEVTLPPGSYELAVSLDGYEPRRGTARVGTDVTTPVRLDLTPPPPSYRGRATLSLIGGIAALGFAGYAGYQAKSAADDFKIGQYDRAGSSRTWTGMMYAGAAVGVGLEVLAIVLFGASPSVAEPAPQTFSPLAAAAMPEVR